jgi:hypothetical protein
LFIHIEFGNIPYLTCKIRFEAPKRQRGREAERNDAVCKVMLTINLHNIKPHAGLVNNLIGSDKV